MRYINLHLHYITLHSKPDESDQYPKLNWTFKRTCCVLCAALAHSQPQCTTAQRKFYTVHLSDFGMFDDVLLFMFTSYPFLSLLPSVTYSFPFLSLRFYYLPFRSPDPFHPSLISHFPLSITTEITSCAPGDTICLRPSPPIGAQAPHAPQSRRNVAVLSHTEYVPTLTAAAALHALSLSWVKRPSDLDLWAFYLENGVRVTCDMGFICPILVFLDLSC